VPRERPADLPDFETPPLREVVVGVQFEPLRGLRQAHLGDYWQHVREEFPSTQDRPPLESALEIAGGPRPQTLEVQFGTPPPTLCWFVSSGGDRLIQVQHDRFLLNWRRTDDGAGYASFEPILAQFSDRFRQFVTWATDNGMPVKPIQTEVSYINVFDSDRISDWLTIATHPAEPLGLLEPTGERWQARHPLDDRFEGAGALYLQIVRDGGPVSFNLTARVRLEASDDEAIEEVLLASRRTIVETFDRSLSTQAKTSLGRKP
jgi:uncharacterized protein (TIGR04255 family)